MLRDVEQSAIARPDIPRAHGGDGAAGAAWALLDAHGVPLGDNGDVPVALVHDTVLRAADAHGQVPVEAPSRGRCFSLPSQAAYLYLADPPVRPCDEPPAELDRFARGLAHDFNNLLTVIGNSLDLLEQRCTDDPRGVSLCTTAQRATEHASLLTRQLLVYAGEHGGSRQRIDLNAILRSALPGFSRLCPPGIQIHAQWGAQLPAVQLDAQQLEAAIANLIVNAIDAFADNGVIILRTGVRDTPAGTGGAPARQVLVSVIDHGVGMSIDVAARASEPFFTTREVGRGSGLGLSQVRGFVRQSGGEVVIDSQEGEGTTVSLSFPVVEEADT